MACASVVSPIEIFAADEVGRRRHWSDEDKVRIVEESLRGYRQGSATARRYGISRSLLSIWRREYRGGTLGAPEAGGFMPLVMEGPPPASAERPSELAPISTGHLGMTMEAWAYA
ncbi:transposase [Rhodovulum visakhapatnamense]|uniref:transposase n=1 Tax=Rhodovulum visakhapatnamense TaxID=364297 RepID=UPI0010650A31|nr:transposase [Rhodovulum visakhapatnamense]